MKTIKTDITEYRFYKEKDICWYIDLPSYPGKQDDLLMVAGADRLLDDLSGGKEEIWLAVSET